MMKSIIAFLILLQSSVLVLAQVTAAPASICLSGATPFLLSNSSLPLGFYSPFYDPTNPATFPVQCAPTDDCTLRRLTTRWCDAQGTYEPVLCPAGNYCPEPNIIIECPSGYFCPQGTSVPIDCGALSSCPAGSSKKTELSSLLAVVIVDTFLVSLYYIMTAWRRRQWKKRDQANAQVQLASVNPSLRTKGLAYQQLPAHSKLLCQGFRRAQQELPCMRLDFQDLSITIPARGGAPANTILKGVTGTVAPAKVTAIMGPSGAGKTTLLTALLGSIDQSFARGGSLTINGMDESIDRFRKIIGYVPQAEIMHRDLSVYDNIRYSAKVRLPTSWTDKQKDDHVNATISAMQLSHVQDVLVGDEVKRGISGGQMKRVNIGMEVAAAPALLLLDEPTSGLDSTAAMEICQVLKDIAKIASITVCMVIHQPRKEVWRQLDEVLLLAKGGLTVYQGPQRVAEQYFKQRFDVYFDPQENPADILMDKIAEQGDEFVARWKEGGREIVQQLIQANMGSEISPPIIVPDEDEEPVLEVHENSKDQSYHQAHAHEVPVVPAAASSVPASNGQASRYGAAVIHVAPAPKKLDHDSVTFQIPVKGMSTHESHPPAFGSRVAVRSTAGFFTQIWLAMVRSLWKQTANLPSLYLEAGLGLLAGAMMGAMIKVQFQGILTAPFTLLSASPNDHIVGTFMFNVGLAISLAAVSAGVSVFGEEQVIYRREVAAGHNHLAYYIGVNIAQYPRLFIDAIHFTFIFHILNRPVTTFGNMLVIVFFIYAGIYGLAFLVSMLVSRKNAALLGVVLSLTFASMTAKGGQPEPIQYLSVARWASEAMFTFETKPFLNIMDVASSANDQGYVLDRIGTDIFLIFLNGIIYRLLAYAFMRFVDRKILKN